MLEFVGRSSSEIFTMSGYAEVATRYECRPETSEERPPKEDAIVLNSTCRSVWGAEGLCGSWCIM